MCKRGKEYCLVDDKKFLELQVEASLRDKYRVSFKFTNTTANAQRITFRYQIGPTTSHLRELKEIGLAFHESRTFDERLSKEEFFSFLGSNFHCQCEVIEKDPKVTRAKVEANKKYQEMEKSYARAEARAKAKGIDPWIDYKITESNRRDLGIVECNLGCHTVGCVYAAIYAEERKASKKNGSQVSKKKTGGEPPEWYKAVNALGRLTRDLFKDPLTPDQFEE